MDALAPLSLAGEDSDPGGDLLAGALGDVA